MGSPVISQETSSAIERRNASGSEFNVTTNLPATDRQALYQRQNALDAEAAQAILPELETTIHSTTGNSQVSQAQHIEMLEEAQAKLRRKLKSAENLQSGSEAWIKRLEEDASAAERWFSWRTDGPVIRERIASERKLLEAQRERTKELREKAERFDTALKEGKELLETAKRLEASGDLNAAREVYSKAQSIFDTIELDGSKISSINREAAQQYIKRNQELHVQHMLAIQTMETRENIARGARDALVIGGAVIATGGAAAAVGGAAGLGAGLVAGTGYGAVAGGASMLTEAGGHVALGNKDVSQALQDAGQDTIRITKDAAVASASTLVAGGVVAKVAGRAASAVLANHNVRGSIAGGTASVFSDASQTAIGLINGTEKRSWGQILSDGSKNAAVGIVSGALGAHAGALKHGQSLGRVVAVSAGQVGAEAAVGVGAEYAQAKLEGRQFSSSQAMATAVHSVAMGTIGEVVSTAASRATPVGKSTGQEKSERSMLERAMALSTEAEQYLGAKADEIGNAVAENIARHREKVELAATRAADATANDLAQQVRSNGADILTAANVEKSAQVHTYRETKVLLTELNVEADVRERTIDFLQETRGKSVKQIRTEIEQSGIADSKRANRVARELYDVIRTGHKDGHIKDVMTERITNRVSSALEGMMEKPWRNRFRANLRGEVDSFDSEVLGKAARERSTKLGKNFNEFVDDLTDAGWRGAKKGIRQATQEIVRRGVEEGFRVFRSRVNPQFVPVTGNAKEDRQHLTEGGHKNAEAQTYKAGSDENGKHDFNLNKVPSYTILDIERGHQYRKTFEYRGGRWELVHSSDLGEVIVAKAAEEKRASDIREERPSKNKAA